MAYETLILELSPPVAVLRLDRPDAANAINRRMGGELAEALGGLKGDIRAVVLTGEGRHFCAGADLKERKGMDMAAWEAQHGAFRRGYQALLGCPLPVIAAVNGAAMGGGLELALACDFIVASTSAKFALPESSLGIMPGLGGTQTLPRRIGTAKAKEMMFAAKPITAPEALKIGLVNHVFEPEALLPEALKIAQAIAQNAPLSLQAIKASVNQGIALPLADALNCELAHYRKLLQTKDRHEGINAFNEKRKASFTGN